MCCGSSPAWKKGAAMFKQILVAVDGSRTSSLPTSDRQCGRDGRTVRRRAAADQRAAAPPVMLAEYVPPDFELQQRRTAEDALSIIVRKSARPFARVIDRAAGRHPPESG
jgi:hypothetical protein